MATKSSGTKGKTTYDTSYKAPAYKAPTYTAPQYDEKKYRKGVDTSYYTNAVNDYTKQANAERQTQLGEAQKTQEANLRQAYVNRLQNERNLNQNLVNQGIRGGATETANLMLANQYGQARAAANTDYANAVNSINRATDQNIRDYTNDMNSRAEQYRQNMAQMLWQADREAATTKSCGDGKTQEMLKSAGSNGQGMTH